MDAVSAETFSGESFHKALRVQKIISSVALGEVLLFAGVGYVLTAGVHLDKAVPLPLLIACGLLGFGFPWILPALSRRLLTQILTSQRPRTPEAVLQACNMVHITLTALRTVPGVVSLPLMLLTGAPLWCLATTAIALMHVLQHWPDPERLSACVHEQCRRVRLENPVTLGTEPPRILQHNLRLISWIGPGALLLLLGSVGGAFYLVSAGQAPVGIPPGVPMMFGLFSLIGPLGAPWLSRRLLDMMRKAETGRHPDTLSEGFVRLSAATCLLRILPGMLSIFVAALTHSMLGPLLLGAVALASLLHGWPRRAQAEALLADRQP